MYQADSGQTGQNQSYAVKRKQSNSQIMNHFRKIDRNSPQRT